MNCKKCHREISDGSIFCNYCGKKQQSIKRKHAKRASGTGCIYKTNRATPYLAYSPTHLGCGRKYLGSYPTQAEAQAAIEAYNNSKWTDLNNATLQQIYDLWSAEHFPRLSKSGEQGYKTGYKYLSPLYHRKIKELKTIDYQKCIQTAADEYSRDLCEKIKSVSRQLCKYAIKNDIIEKNYADFVVLPKAHKTERECFTKAELDILWKHTDDDRAKIILIMCYTGFRIGEMATIKRENIHLDERYIIGGIKTEAGTDRYVPIIEKILPFVEYFYNRNQKDVFFADVSNFRKRDFYPCLIELGIIEDPEKDENGQKHYRLTPHCTRHTFASLADQAGLNKKSLQKIIGHAKIETTENIYMHKDRETLQKEMQRL